METVRPAYAETPEGLFIPHPGAAGGRWGCVSLVVIAGLGPGIGCLVYGAIVPGVVLVAAGLSLALFIGGLLTPSGLIVTGDAVRLERRSAFRSDALEVPRRLWKELWIEESEEEKTLLYLLTSSPDGRETTHAIPLFAGSPAEARQVAGRVGGLLRLPWQDAIVVPESLRALDNLKDAVAGGLAAYRKAKDQTRQAVAAAGADPDSRTPEARAAVQQVGKTIMILKGFGSIESPEAWLIDRDRSTVTHLNPAGGATAHSFGEVASVEIEAEAVDEERGSDSDTEYVNRYAVYLVLHAGPRFLLRRYASSENKKAGPSGASRQARWFARYLRKTFGLRGE
jgi:hypothetical protein